MQLKNSIVGAVVGGAIGAGLLVAAYFLFGIEHTALAILVAIVTGLGVRAAAATKGHASYIRGALTCLVALAAFMGGKLLVAQIAVSQTAARAAQPLRPSTPPSDRADRAAPPESATDDADDKSIDVDSKKSAEEPSVAEPPQAEPQLQHAARRPAAASDLPPRVQRPAEFSPWDFIWLSVAALVAYELGRGSGVAPPAAAAPAAE